MFFRESFDPLSRLGTSMDTFLEYMSTLCWLAVAHAQFNDSDFIIVTVLAIKFYCNN